MRGLLILALTVSLAAQDQGILRSTRADRTDLSLTVYHPYSGPSGSHPGFGLLREVRRVKVPRGRFTLRWEGLPRDVTEASAQLEAVTPTPRLTTLERNYDRNLITRASLLAASLHAPVEVGSSGGPARPAVLKSLPEGKDGEVVVATAEGFEAAAPNQVHLRTLPPTLSAEPTLSTVLESEAAGEVELRLTLLVEHITWSARYILDLEPSLTRGRLEGHAVIENRSGMAFEGARLALVAGPVNRVRGPQNPQRVDGPAVVEVCASVAVVAGPVVEPLGEVYLYAWNHPFTLGTFQTKALALLGRDQVKVEPTLQCSIGLYTTWSSTSAPREAGTLELKVFNEPRLAHPGPWPEGTWEVRIPTPSGPPLRVEDAGTATPVGESLSFSSPPVKVWARSRQVDSAERDWGRYSKVETWEVEVAREAGLSIPMPAQLIVVPNGGDLEVYGPPEGRMEAFAFRMPLDLSHAPRQKFRFTVRHPRN